PVGAPIPFLTGPDEVVPCFEMMKMKSYILSLLVVVAMTVSLVCLAGCGGSSETSAAKPQPAAAKPRSPAEKPRSPRTPAERARFIKRGNAICKRADAEQHKRAVRYLKKEGPLNRKWELVAPAVVPPMKRALKELKALKPPEGEEPRVWRILQAMAVGVEDAEADPIDLIFTWSDPFQEARRLDKKYGLTVCAFSSQVIIQPREEKNMGF
ncbi:MAG: hypothetical protein ACTHLH_05440, partial [Solirubrobacterales bacterium]